LSENGLDFKPVRADSLQVSRSVSHIAIEAIANEVAE
jgi:hypothetical protein